ncbi:hypothetical protein VOLCADRAFT_94410 [Volvox carteri f. nagariensis]|uniref:THH1/TOM1/TOM3 domain-containing protein n=1 Tax=Volvox carteri f. nagariensis TaxID=3068 RepID=D8U4Q4_VOLCA|nr:uncharacterized protein VOLCADRAFT_94410 [Volvox carteri f. nagariensis]EFJ45316.1 hypothetical protein VOLCADRAFT_94410 [Volvox carteri f. nagariensis]|eukprot:XP_002953692.1 hypothetical protein VOLCADRAFT_94410 [Volvox carteri f. nagariensis]
MRMPVLSQPVVDGIDWGIVGVAGCLLLVSVVGALLALRYSSSKRRPVAREFNYLWRVRAFTELLAAGYALAHLLRLQVLWGPASVFKAGGYHPTSLCRVYIAATYGVFEPGFLLLALFACLYSVQGRDSSKHPNFNIVVFSTALSLPSCAIQLVAALFTRIFDLNYANNRMLGRLFSAYDTSLHQHCDAVGSAGTGDPTAIANCAFCVFPLLSTFASTALSAVFLLAFWLVTQRIAATVINKALSRRVRMLQASVTLWIIVSLACRGCTVLFRPFDLGFEVLRAAHVLAVAALVITLEFFLVLKPVWDTHVADRAVKRFERQDTGGLPQPLLPNPLYPPTELQLLESSTSTRQHGEEERV